MNRRRAFFYSLSTLTLFAAAALAQTRPAASPPAPAIPPAPPTPAAAAPASAGPRTPTGPSELKIMLMDGSIVSGKLSISELAIDTKFGTLKIPVDQVQSLRPGLQSHPKFKETVEGYINDLAADGFPDREKAQAALTRIGPEIKSELERQIKTSQAEKQMRLQKIVEEFESQMEDEDSGKSRQWTPEDVIVTPGFTVVGRIVTPGFAVTSPYGTLQLKFEDIREARRDDQMPEDINKSVTIAGTTINTKTPVNSNIRLTKGDQVTISASGNIVLTPWGQQNTTPDGNTDIGNNGTGGFPIGTLYARIGDSGPYIKVGSKASFTAPSSGVLNLGISFPNSNYGSTQFPGEYQAKIRVVKKP